VADLGLPWHFYHLAIQHPEHSAMFEVSWCVGLYVTVLFLEFLPVPLEKLGYAKLHDAWKRWSGAFVAVAMGLFVWMLTRNLACSAVTAAIFGVVAWIFRWRGGASEPILLAIAAVTLSTMHQSSLGSLFLLMGDQLAPAWWTPVLPITFFVSSIAAGTALVILIDFWIAKGWRRPLDVKPLAAMGQVTFWSLLAYLAFRLADMGVSGRLAAAFSGRLGPLFGLELALGIVPLLLLGSKARRENPKALFTGALLAALGIVLNRTNVVLLAMKLNGTMPQTGPEPYTPSFYEWGISVGLIAATIFLFGLGARWLPLLPKREGSGAPHP
jgi:formate dehydrogenase iron-sulfur subunit